MRDGLNGAHRGHQPKVDPVAGEQFAVLFRQSGRDTALRVGGHRDRARRRWMQQGET